MTRFYFIFIYHVHRDKRINKKKTIKTIAHEVSSDNKNNKTSQWRMKQLIILVF